MNRKLHWAALRRELAPWRAEVGWAWKCLPSAERARVMNRRCLVSLEIPVPDRRHRDPANMGSTVGKQLIDQLVLQGVWKNDGPEWVKTEEPVLVYKGVEVVVRLTPID